MQCKQGPRKLQQSMLVLKARKSPDSQFAVDRSRSRMHEACRNDNNKAATKDNN